jgi:hypothetical protein
VCCYLVVCLLYRDLEFGQLTKEWKVRKLDSGNVSRGTSSSAIAVGREEHVLNLLEQLFGG